MDKTLYTKSRQEDSYCPECGEHVMLLSATGHDLPAFYICLGGGCGFVGQVGVGPVPEHRR